MTSAIAALALAALSACWRSAPYEPPGRFSVDSVYAEIRVSADPLQEPGSSCYFFIAYQCEILGGVIDNICVTLPDGARACVFRDYVLPCYIPPEQMSVDSVDLNLFEERFQDVDTTDVIVEVHGFMPDERLYLNYCAMQDFSYVDTLRAPVRRASL